MLLGEIMIRMGMCTNITGIIEDVPANSHLEFDLLASVETISSLRGRRGECIWILGKQLGRSSM